jgi:hypothetical protein
MLVQLPEDYQPETDSHDAMIIEFERQADDDEGDFIRVT